MKNDTLRKAIEFAGSQPKLAALLGTSQQCISLWNKSRIPANWIVRIEQATGVPRAELRPDLYE